MNLYRYATAFCCFLLLFSGCASTMRVSVEMIEPAGAKQPEADIEIGQPSLVQAVQATVDALTDYVDTVTMLQNKYDSELEQSFSTLLSPIYNYKSEIANGNALLSEVNPTDTMPDRYTLALKMRSYINKIEAIDTTYGEQAIKEVENARNSLSLKGKADTQPIPDAIRRLIARLQTETQNAKEISNRSSGFGGFENYGVYVINPGDPRYSDVLHGNSVGVISEAKTEALGDSTIVFFQETPTEIKNFSTDLNAEQLMKNVALISDKSVTAFSKYLSAGAGIPAP